jgi:hypothetical protein
MSESARKTLARRIFKTSNIKGEFLLRSGVTSSINTCSSPIRSCSARARSITG